MRENPYPLKKDYTKEFAALLPFTMTGAQQRAVQDGIRADWAEFIPQTETKGAQVDNPPANNGQSAEPKSLAEAMRMRYEKGN